MTSIRTQQMATRIEFGLGASRTVGQEARKLGGRHALLVTGKNVTAAGLLDGIQQSLAEAGIAATVFYQLRPDPTTGDVNSAADAYLGSGCDCFVAVGGGSPLDCAKGAGIVAAGGGRIEDFRPLGKRPIEKHLPPLITIPTTAGSGSEISTGVVLTYEETHAKLNFTSLVTRADVALFDPELTRSMPPSVTVSSGLDALSHGLERYTATDATPLTDALTLECIRLVAGNLRQAYANGNNMQARENMMWASLMGAMPRNSISSPHSIASVVGGHCRIAHGAACGILQPACMEFNLIANPPKFAAVAAAMGERVEGLSTLDAAQRAVEAMKRLLADVGIPTRLRDYGLREEDLSEIAEVSMKLRPAILTRSNPRAMTVADIEAVLRRCY